MSTLRTNQIQTTGGRPILNNTGGILQVVQAWDDTVRSGAGTNSPTYQTIAGPQVTITPSNSSHKILLIAQITFASGAANAQYDTTYRLARNGTGIGRATSGQEGSIGINCRERYELGNGAIVFLDSPGATTAVTYSIQVCTGSSGHNWKINESGDGGDRGVSCIIAMEVTA